MSLRIYCGDGAVRPIHWFSWNVVLVLMLLLGYHRHPRRQLNSRRSFDLAKTVGVSFLAPLLLSSHAILNPALLPPNIENLLLV